MKRTGEVILGIIGAAFYAFLAVIGGSAIWLKNNPDLVQEALDQSPEDLGISASELAATMGSGGVFLVVSSVIAIILGVVAMVLLRGNKKPKVAGIIFIATSVIFTVITFGGGIFAGILYLIAGIMCLVRKPKQLIEE
ncbi:DUF4064 domain-containing protein [Ornithinibacillus sp. L9]|uniref:DUF4064 domain-containing protein n=1 Tax=Ornithinibacillus caprae TaxID=2678566 RepID=A0A6N8FNT0_9BACI|nr:DUF4064 domain-containing protein [Ornithinibacillus caprae]MUK89747.1 DUF4064 domain-containing protein [Ornithinibacillus caprae]